MSLGLGLGLGLSWGLGWGVGLGLGLGLGLCWVLAHGWQHSAGEVCIVILPAKLGQIC